MVESATFVSNILLSWAMASVHHVLPYSLNASVYKSEPQSGTVTGNGVWKRAPTYILIFLCFSCLLKYIMGQNVFNTTLHFKKGHIIQTFKQFCMECVTLCATYLSSSLRNYLVITDISINSLLFHYNYFCCCISIDC